MGYVGSNGAVGFIVDFVDDVSDYHRSTVGSGWSRDLSSCLIIIGFIDFINLVYVDRHIPGTGEGRFDVPSLGCSGSFTSSFPPKNPCLHLIDRWLYILFFIPLLISDRSILIDEFDRFSLDLDLGWSDSSGRGGSLLSQRGRR